MIAVLKPGASKQQIESLVSWLHSRGLKTNIFEGEHATIIGLIGDTSQLDINLLEGLEIIESVKRITEPFKKANRKFHPMDTVIDINGLKLGGGNFHVIAGPCSVESYEQILSVAESVKASGATMLRGGAFKPRTSPYDFQGLRAEGIELLLEAKAKTGLPIVSEIMSVTQLPLFEQVDVIQVGARNMQNFELLKELGHVKKPVLLKRGFMNTLTELLMSAEYIIAGGNPDIILCERGIRTFETYTRNTLDLSAVPVLQELSHLPVIIDPSHAVGISRFMKPMALAAVASGADGLIIEVHNDPPNAISDGAQSITPEQFADLSEKIRRIREVIVAL